MQIAGLTLKQFAGAVKRDERQCARWMRAEERPQFDAIASVPLLREPLLLALGEALGGDVEIRIRLPRRA